VKSTFPKEKVRLKDGVLLHQEIREWEFQRLEEGMVSLTHPAIRYVLGVKEDCIDWDASPKAR
jgi:hypothetical protein